jgi:hypothetical protein
MLPGTPLKLLVLMNMQHRTQWLAPAGAMAGAGRVAGEGPAEAAPNAQQQTWQQGRTQRMLQHQQRQQAALQPSDGRWRRPVHVAAGLPRTAQQRLQQSLWVLMMQLQ